MKRNGHGPERRGLLWRLLRRLPIEPTDENLALVRGFLLEVWKERHRELGLASPAPDDLSDSCKFSALFGAVVFGAEIGGDYDRVHNVSGRDRTGRDFSPA